MISESLALANGAKRTPEVTARYKQHEKLKGDVHSIPRRWIAMLLQPLSGLSRERALAIPGQLVRALRKLRSRETAGRRSRWRQ